MKAEPEWASKSKNVTQKSMDYLLKTEPSTYSFSDLQREKITIWDGVSNELSLLLRLAVDNSIIAVPLELQLGKLLSHPHVERVMQEQVG